ncbi:hypothetical protein K3495_g11390 [Podosphaera aphanis]|nr:hypothetical protein K3495_g11390 [Podosphaera aphanis]
MTAKDSSTTVAPQSSSNAKFFNNPEYSDVTIKIFDTDLFAHQIVICEQSEYFKRALQKGSQQFIEAETKTIEFKEGSGAAYWRVFEYLYFGYYSDELSTAGLKDFPDDPELLIDVRVYALADMFLIEGLKILSEVKFAKRLENCQLDAAFITCAREVYEHNRRADSEMRRVVTVNAVSKSKNVARSTWGKSLLDRKNMLRLKSFIGEGGEFAQDYLVCILGLQRSDLEEPKLSIS